MYSQNQYKAMIYENFKRFYGKKDKCVQIIHTGIYTPEYSKKWNCDNDMFTGLLMTSQGCQNRPVRYPVGRIMQMIKNNLKIIFGDYVATIK